MSTVSCLQQNVKIADGGRITTDGLIILGVIHQTWHLVRCRRLQRTAHHKPEDWDKR
jgi:hypothetical protein